MQAADNTQKSFSPKPQAVPDKLKFLLLTAVLAVIFFASFLFGRYPVTPDMVLTVLIGKILALPQTWPDNMETIVMEIRLPRILAAILVGGALSAAGAAYQNLFQNPIVTPEIMGATWGAAFGAILGMIFQFPWLMMEFTAFCFGLAAVFVAVFINSFFGGNKFSVTMVLAGYIVSAFFQAGLSVLKYLADPMDTLPALTFWLMGGLSKVGMTDILWTALPVLIPVIILYIARWRINVLSVGEEEAQTLGVNIKFTRFLVLSCATLMIAAVVSISGIIHWVGLVIPHLARMLVGADFSRVLPATILLGSSYLLAMDTLSRSIAAIEIQVGIFTAIIGAPVFVFLLMKAKKGWV